MTTLKKIADFLKTQPRWRILCHVKPDGDTLGSASALVSAGKSLGCDVQWGGPDPVPAQYRFLPWIAEYRVFDAVPKDDCCQIAIDVSTPDRTVQGARIHVCVDHHPDNQGFGLLNWIHPEASSAGEIVYDLIRELDAPVDLKTAEALYVSIMTDTGGFKYSNTGAQTLHVASELVKAGVCPDKIDEQLYYNDSIAKLHLWGRCLNRVRQINGRAVLSWVSRQDFKETGAAEDDTESLVNMLNRVAGTQAAVLVNEISGALRCSIRSRGDCSAQQIASKWGGGGHKYAAGCTIALPLEEGLLALEEELRHV
ncbi:MAG: bifunctional oligoribonuclease/PAP phosphatase NrnA [Pyramidobacter sp.]|nr:bifunctional oligoribonuclease/PAP phosphatase NrnA [Pyramidobacter sp.]